MNADQMPLAAPVRPMTLELIDDHGAAGRSGRLLGPVSTLVSLFLLLLVFFVLLFSIAEIHHHRTSEVLTSVDTAFSGIPSRLGLIPRVAAPPVETPTEKFIQEVSLIITGFAPINPGEAEHGGGSSLLRVDFQPEMLFDGSSARLTSEARAMVPRLAVALEGQPGTKLRYQMIFRNNIESALPATRALRLDQAAALAASLFEAGCPPEALRVGVQADTAPGSVIEFHALESAAETE